MLLLKNMIESTKDILFLVLAFCVLWFTVFVCWFIYYMIVMIRDVKEMVHIARNIFRKAEELVDFVRNRAERGASYIGLAADVFKNVMPYVEKARARKKTKRKKKSEEVEL